MDKRNNPNVYYCVNCDIQFMKEEDVPSHYEIREESEEKGEKSKEESKEESKDKSKARKEESKDAQKDVFDDLGWSCFVLLI